MTFVVALTVAVATVALDLASKHVVMRRFVEGRLYGVGAFGVRRVHNDRGAIVALSPSQALSAWAAMAGVVGLVLALSAPAPGPAVAAGLGMVVGGAAGNVSGRFIHGTVVDFIAAWRWPVFNMADGAMVAGVALTALGLR